MLRFGWLVGVVLVAGCGLFDSPKPLVFTPAAPPLSDDADHLAWAESEPYFVVVRKECRTLDVYRFGQRVESFPVVLGLNNPGRKLYEGDLRTPSGLYGIVAERQHQRWQHFMLLDYPNLGDRERYRQALSAGDIPDRGGWHPGLGGLVGIHGTDKPDMNRRGLNWTWGCVSLQREDIRKLARMVPEGTLVLIQD